MQRLRFFWSQIPQAIVLLAAIFAIITFIQGRSCANKESSEADRLRKGLEQLKGQPAKNVGSGQQWKVGQAKSSYSEIELGDGAEVLISQELKEVSIYSMKMIIGSNVKIIGKGKDGTDGNDGSQPGQSGRCGDGASGSEGKHGTSGSNGASVDIETLEMNFSGTPLIIDLSGGHGGNGGKGGKGGKGGQASTSRNCRGGTGGRGGKGGNAGDGGNGGSMSIEYIAATFNNLPFEDIEKMPIIGFSSESGKRGTPGAPGPRGDPGEGKNSPINPLDQEPAGHPGSLGDPGLEGKDGRRGELELKKVRD